jgi:hypothetical protein
LFRFRVIVLQVLFRFRVIVLQVLFHFRVIVRFWVIWRRSDVRGNTVNVRERSDMARSEQSGRDTESNGERAEYEQLFEEYKLGEVSLAELKAGVRLANHKSMVTMHCLHNHLSDKPPSGGESETAKENVHGSLEDGDCARDMGCTSTSNNNHTRVSRSATSSDTEEDSGDQRADFVGRAHIENGSQECELTARGGLGEKPPRVPLSATDQGRQPGKEEGACRQS